jgi:glycosyltransferase involved in cell wall biosynthesis
MGCRPLDGSLLLKMDTKPQSQILALIPAFNEESHIASVVTRALRFLPVLVVDDGSSDQTATLALQAGAQVYSLKPNQGKGAALKAGFQWALEHGFDTIIMLDGDGQHDPDEIPTFLDCYHSHHSDQIIGYRDFAKMPFPRNISNTLGRYLLSWAMGQYVIDNQSGYRLVSSDLIKNVLLSQEGGFEFEVDMVVICTAQHLRLDWIPIRTIYADEKSHISPIRHVIKYFKLIWRVSQQRKKHES